MAKKSETPVLKLQPMEAPNVDLLYNVWESLRMAQANWKTVRLAKSNYELGVRISSAVDAVNHHFETLNELSEQLDKNTQKIDAYCDAHWGPTDEN